ncbi:MAG TPA: class I SAM-dependent methyltransferase [Micromonosporaceae bacterium]|jgi:SAM-dependent methyltransferase
MAERVRARVFGEVAGDYDRFRPSYPPELVDDTLRYAGIDRKSSRRAVLDVGAGTGKATIAFAERGMAVTAVEPDVAMASVLRERIAGDLDIRVVASSFEDFVADQPYQLLVSGQAWHWTDPAVRWERAAAALAPGGALALFWNHESIADTVARKRIIEAHRELAPSVELDPDPIDDETVATAWPYDEMVARSEFADVDSRVYHWSRTIPAASYVAMLSTHSAYRILDAPQRDAILSAVADRLGEHVDLGMDTIVYFARRV